MVGSSGAALAAPNPDSSNLWNVALGIDWAPAPGLTTATFLQADGVSMNNCGGPLTSSRTACNFLNRYTIGGVTTQVTTTPSSLYTAADHLNLFDEPAPEGSSFAQGSFGEVFQAPSTGTLSSFELKLACKIPTGGSAPSIQGTLFELDSTQINIVSRVASVNFDFNACPTTTSFNPSPATFGWVPFAFNAPVTSGTNYTVLLTGSAIGGYQPTIAPSTISGLSAAATVGVAYSDSVGSDGSPAPTYAVTGGALPAGLSLNTTTGAVTGTPTTAGAYSVTITATNTAGTTNHTFTGTVAAAAPSVTAPSAPTGLSVRSGDGSASLEFAAPASNGGSAITRYEVSTDGGATWHTLTTSVTGSTLSALVNGLSNGLTYPVVVRAVNSAGTGTASTTVAVTPTAARPTPPSAPSAPTAVPGTATATVSWNASSSPSVTGYTVVASPGPATCSTSSPTETSCVIGAESGVTYTYTVIAHSSAGDSLPSSPSSAVTPSAPPVPLTPPTGAEATLTTTDGKLTTVRPAQPVTVVGTGFAAHSTVKVVIYSSPLVLATVTTDGSGDFSAPVTVPADLPAGDHTFVAAGTDPDGRVRQMQMPVTLTAGLYRAPAPTRVTVGAGDRSITLAFAPVRATRGSRVVGYQVSLDGGRTWKNLNTSGTARLKASIGKLSNGKTYPVRVRARIRTTTASGVLTGFGMPSASTRITPMAPWYHDPVSAAGHRSAVAVPAKPATYHGAPKLTRANYRSHNGTIAVPASWVKGHSLLVGQAATLHGKGLFAFDSAVITTTGTSQLRTLAASLGKRKALTCEGYSDYAGDAGHEKTLSTRRATAVCAALRSFGVRADLRSVGYGRARPVVIGGNRTARIANRRVVVLVTR